MSKHLTKSEQDMEERLTAREHRVREQREDTPDPIRKRLYFLLRKHSRQRQRLEEVLAARENTHKGGPLVLQGDVTAVSISNASHGGRTPHVRAHVDRRTRESPIHSVALRLHAAWTRMLAVLGRSFPFVLTARR